MKLLLSILTSILLIPAFGQVDSLKLKQERDRIKQIFVKNKFKETKVKTDVPLDILQKAGIHSHENIDGITTILNWAAKAKTGIWVVSVSRASCGLWTAVYIIDHDNAINLNYGNETTTFRQFKKWCLGKRQPVMF